MVVVGLEAEDFVEVDFVEVDSVEADLVVVIGAEDLGVVHHLGERVLQE